jgi:hypothetical protein
MTKKDVGQIASFVLGSVAVLFYWWATITGFEWKGDGIDMLVVWVPIIAVILGLIMFAVAVPIMLFQYVFRHKEQRQSDSRHQVAYVTSTANHHMARLKQGDL